MPAPLPSSTVFDCPHGQIRVSVMHEVGYVTLSGDHPILTGRDKPSVTLLCEGTLVDECRHLIAGKLAPQHFAQILLGRHPQLQCSEWRRSLVRDYFAAAAPFDPAKAVREGLGVE